MTGAALATLLALAAARLEVSGDATCPAPGDVARRLAELLPDAAPRAGDAAAHETGGARVIVTRNGAALRLVLLGPNANELAVRELGANESCEDLAAAAAVVVATWQADLDTELAPAVALPVKPTPPAAPPPAAPPAVARAAPAVPAHGPRLELGLGLLVSDVDGDLAPGAILTGSLGRGALALDASLQGTTSRGAAVGALGDVASWTRVTLAAGPAFQHRRGDLRVDVHAQALLGILHVRGVGLPSPSSDTTPELGLGGGVRVGLVTGTSVAWLGFDVLGWPGEQRLLIQGVPDQGRLARLEVVASAGLGLGRFP